MLYTPAGEQNPNLSKLLNLNFSGNSFPTWGLLAIICRSKWRGWDLTLYLLPSISIRRGQNKRKISQVRISHPPWENNESKKKKAWHLEKGIFLFSTGEFHGISQLSMESPCCANLGKSPKLTNNRLAACFEPHQIWAIYTRSMSLGSILAFCW